MAGTIIHLASRNDDFIGVVFLVAFNRGLAAPAVIVDVKDDSGIGRRFGHRRFNPARYRTASVKR